MTSHKSATTNICLKLRNGNVISGKTAVEKIVFTTRYGTLYFPAKDLSQIEFGIITTEETHKNATELLNALLISENEKDAENIFNQISKLEIGAIPVLENEAHLDTNIDWSFNIEEAIKQLKEKHEVSEYFTEDIVSLPGDYRISGICDIQQIEVATEFGLLNIPREKITSVEILQEEDVRYQKYYFKLEANQHISVNPKGGWLKTNIRLRKGQKFTIESKGEIILASLSNQPHKPDGSYLPAGGPWTSGNDHDPNAAPIYGNVIYKIGEAGMVQKAGTKIKAQAPVSGILFLSIFETVYNTTNTGHYTVSVVA